MAKNFYYDECGPIEKIILTIKKRLKPLFMIFYIPRLQIETALYNRECKDKKYNNEKKNLYMSPVGTQGKKFLKKIIKRFGHKNFDFLLIVYDDTEFKEEIFKKCNFIYDKGYKWKLVKKYVTPELSEKYNFLFLWDDDIDIGDFSPDEYLGIIKRNYLQFSQPALTKNSEYTHKLTLQNSNYKIGRYTDFVEVMVCVFESSIWPKFWEMMEDDYNHWGWGYDSMARSILGLKNLGIVDKEPVYHTKPLRGWLDDSGGDYNQFRRKHKKYLISKFVSYGELK